MRRAYDFIEKRLDFVGFNSASIKKSCRQELIAAFDPSYILKSGKQSLGLCRWWSGKDQCTLKGLEISSLAIVDTEAGNSHDVGNCASNIQRGIGIKKSKSGKPLREHNKKEMPTLKTMVKYLATDGFCMKHDFIVPLLKEGLHAITKMRPGANLSYPYTGSEKIGRVRPKAQDGKVDPIAIGCSNVDKRRVKKFDEDEDAVQWHSVA